MTSLGIILRKPPYGTVEAPEAIRHALGAVTEDLSVRFVLLDGGVNAARKGQDISGTEYLSIEEGIKDCIDMGVIVYADSGSLKEESLNNDDLIDGVMIASGPEVAQVMAEADTIMIF